MAKRREPSHYLVGKVKQEPRGPRPRDTGTFGVIKGEVAEEKGHLEWRHFAEGTLLSSKWYGYRIGPGDGGHGTVTDLLFTEDSKQNS